MLINQETRYILDPTKGSGAKITCPHCGRPKCFKLYVDVEKGEYLADDCGRCDHEQSCGYHYTPRQFFKDNAWRQVTPVENRVVKKVDCSKPEFVTIQREYVQMRHSANSTFMAWLYRVGGTSQQVTEVYEAYHVGATANQDYGRHGVIFWYIDTRGVVHDGKIMWYKVNGHREGYVDWVSCRMSKAGMFAKNVATYKPFYGEHLLPLRPDAHVCVVESEKSALYLACRHPQCVWLATGGCGGLNADKVRVLQGRKVTFFPDSGELEKWKKKMEGVTGIEYNFSDTLEQCPPNTDLVDIYMGEVVLPGFAPEESRRECDVILEAMIAENPDIEELIRVFDLETIGCRHLKPRKQ